MCALVAIFWGQSFALGLYQVCVYDCGYDRPSYLWYDKAYKVLPDRVCPLRLYEK